MKPIFATLFLDITFAILLLLKVFGAGFLYFPVLDDYIQYGSYPLYENLKHVYLDIGTISARPFASLLDPAVWGASFPNMALQLLVITALLFFSAKMFHRVAHFFGARIKPVLYAVYLLLPLGFEATYWISASTRIVVGLFFAALSAYILVKFFENERKLLLIPCALSAILSVGFYESVAVFSCLLLILLIVKHALDEKDKKSLWLLSIPVFAAIAFLVYYLLCSSIGGIGSRATTFTLSGIFPRIKECAVQFWDIFTRGLIETTFVGFKDGLVRLYELGASSLITAVCFLIFSGFIAYLSSKLPFCADKKYCVPVGILLTIVPLLPYVFIGDVWLTYRSVFVCLFGLILLTAPLDAFLIRTPLLRAVCVFLLVFVYAIGGVNELLTYKEVYETDNELLTAIVGHLDEDVRTGKKEAVIVLEEEIVIPQTSYFKDHVKSVFDSDWALTGAVRATAKNLDIKKVTPCLSGEEIPEGNVQILYVDESRNVTEAKNE